jgi:hypothetical protein
MWIEEIGAQTILPSSLRDKLLAPEDIFSCRYYLLEPTTWFCKSDIINKLGGFDIDFYNYDDIDLLTRVILGGEKIYFFNKPLSIKHTTEGISDLSFKSILQKERFLKKHFPKIKKHKKYISKLYYRLGKDLFRLSDFKRARVYFWQAFLSYPIKIEYLFKAIYLFFRKFN